MKVFIDEYDRDYGTVVGYLEKDFETLEDAEVWCKENSWSGYSYWIDRSLTKAVNKE